MSKFASATMVTIFPEIEVWIFANLGSILQTLFSPIFKASLCWKLYVPAWETKLPVVESNFLVNLRFLLGLYISWIIEISLFSYTIRLIFISASRLMLKSSVPFGLTKRLLISKCGKHTFSFFTLFISINPIIGKVRFTMFILLSFDKYIIFMSKFAFSSTLLTLILESILLTFAVTDRISWILLSQLIFSLIFAFVLPIPTIVLMLNFFSSFCKSSIFTSLIFSMLELVKTWTLKPSSALILTFLSLIILQLIWFRETEVFSFISLFTLPKTMIWEKSILWQILFICFFFPSLPIYIT